ncbi:MAG: hypothetical protein SGJ27_11285 [Candidatus Melainabacteria bacterium]|nr:hypothetical protein [Candidatus Melainabacteria bacterium]
MSAKTSVEKSTLRGPSGFLELAGQMLVVDFGRIYHDGAPVGVLYDDGYLQHTSGVLGSSGTLRPIESINGCLFRGIDSTGLELVLPTGERGPSGSMKFNGVLFHVVNGRIAAPDHGLVGELDDEGTIFLRDPRNKVSRRKLDESTQLSTIIDGKKSTGDVLKMEYHRPLYRKDKIYSEAEMIRYFMDFDQLNGTQKKYLFENLRLWAATGLLQVVRKSEGNCALGNVKHGAAGQTGVRTGNVTLDKEEFDRDIEYYYEHGCFAAVTTRIKECLEVRLNLVVAHEFGHQLEFVLSQATQDKIKDLYREQKKRCDKIHPLPHEYGGAAELVSRHQIEKRVFVSGYARSTHHEYWAECAAAFSVKPSREYLKKQDPAVYDILCKIVYEPETVLRPVLVEPIMALQASLRAGGELHENLLNE